VSFNQLNPNLQTLFLKCFKDGHRDPSKRPAAYEWKQVLSNAEKNLKKCRKDQSHYYSNHLKKCPLCNTNTQSSVSGRQKPMPVPKKSPPPTTTKVPSQKKISPTTKAPKTTTHSTSSSRLIKWVISCVLIMILGKFLFFKTLNVYDNTYLSWSVFGGCIGLIHYFFFKGKTKNTIPTFLAFACCWALYEPIQQNSDFIIQIANIPKLIVFNRNILEDSGLFFFGMLFGLFQGIILKKQSLFFHLVFFGGIVFFISGLLSIISTYYISEYLIGLSVYLTWNNLDILYWGNFGLYYGIFTGIFIVK
jgi:hypothetical protein